VTIVSGTTTAVRQRRSGVQLLFPHDSDTYALRVSARVTTEEFERYEPIDEQMDFHEKLRLLYVALTRARDHLVVSVHRTARDLDDADRPKWTHAELLWEAARGANWTALEPTAAPPHEREPVAAPVPFPAWDDWVAQRDAALEQGARPRVRSATAIAREATELADPALAKDARDLELPPWNKGRYGTAVGRAVHAVLQTIDLVTGDGIDATAAAQAAAEGVIGREGDIAALARSALATPTVREAVTGDFRREMYVATQVEGHTLEGYVDLVYRLPGRSGTEPAGGLVVVDYKTDAWRDETDLDAKVARYRMQGASYALALQEATGERVARCVFLFLGTDGAQERTVTDLPRAIDEVRALLAGSAGSG
jgi:ATP-dependent exoDNAse (exonuclease V) beta subunit